MRAGSSIFAVNVLDSPGSPGTQCAERADGCGFSTEGPGGGRVFLSVAFTEGLPVVEIQLAETDRLDWALKQFRRRMLRSGMFRDMRRKRFYEKPSEAKKAKAKAAERRRHKDRKRAARRYDF